MVIQNIVFPDSVCDESKMYFRGEKNLIEDDHILLFKDGWISTDTYMNSLDVTSLRENTQVEKLMFEISFEGSIDFEFIDIRDKNEPSIITQHLESHTRTRVEIPIPYDKVNGSCYCKLYARSHSVFWSGKYIIKSKTVNYVKLALNICTFNRQGQLNRNLNKLRGSSFFKESSEFYGKMHIFVIDNGDSFVPEKETININIYKNSNKGGGSGGFTRGLKEIKKKSQNQTYTHVIFMDDDVEFQLESFYRLFSYLSCLKKEQLSQLAIAGRMFRLDNKKIQFTTVERWNSGNIIHIDGNLDMNIRENAVKSGIPEGDYGGWWFCVYPIQFVENNRPISFFLHCDDVEYGLRFSGKVIALKGVQVWHESAEYRVSPTIVYYDTRNSLIVNALYRQMSNPEQMLTEWGEKLTMYHNEGNQQLKFACTLGLFHFSKGKRILKKGGKIPWLSQQLMKYNTFLMFFNPLFHRYVRYKVEKDYQKIISDYHEYNGGWIWQY